MRKIFITAFILLTLMFNLQAEDLYVYSFNVLTTAQTGEAVTDEEGIQRLSSIFQKSFQSLSSESITYKPLTSQASDKLGETVRTIDNTVSALAVCFFFGIEFVLYGDVHIDKSRNQYTTEVKVYAKSQNSVIYELRYTKIVPKDEEGYVKELAAIVHSQIGGTLAALPQSSTDKKMEQLSKKTEEAAQDAEAAKKQSEKDNIAPYMEKLINVLENIAPAIKENDPNQVNGKIVNMEKVFGIFIGLGYFFEFSGVWKDCTVPLVTLQLGPKFNLLAINTSSFDLYFRPVFLMDYSASMNTPSAGYNYYSRIQSLAGSIGTDFFLEFLDAIGFSIGGGVQYNVDFIAFREGVSKDFYAYISNALGAYANIGLEFVVGNEKNIVLGINNIARWVFYDTIYFDYKILLTTMFKI
jgi:hypothetical protein